MVPPLPSVRARREDAPHRRTGGGDGGDRCRVPVPRLLPHDPADPFYLTMKAFEVADRYQVPAIILTDQSLVDSYAVVPALDPGRVPIRDHLLPVEELNRMAGYDRFSLT
ncbi:MAG TPA: hypothetical protein ENN53_06705, partial [Candidatus Acetothermia bacterium]|nr:hypothetical protein [Candidatus Acetothermia bacterium]